MAGPGCVCWDSTAFCWHANLSLYPTLKHSEGDIAVGAAQQAAQVEIRVQDCGDGIPPEKLEHIFDRFYRGDDASIPGFGLGLAIARSLVEGQGGTIAMQSEVGKGSTLVLRFPAANANGI